MKTFIIKSLLTSPPEADQREGINPYLVRPYLDGRGKRRFFKYDALFMHSLVK
jgi:hypothetical protein